LEAIKADKLTDDEFLESFENTSLPFVEWTHRSHVRIAFIYLRCQPFAEALDRIRTGIQRYNAAHGVPNTPTRGYHETVTVAFTTLVASARQRAAESIDSQSFLESNLFLLDKRVLKRYYSDALLGSATAKSAFVPPDLCPLPTVSTGCSAGWS
jgi:hypothetical protein